MPVHILPGLGMCTMCISLAHHLEINSAASSLLPKSTIFRTLFFLGGGGGGSGARCVQQPLKGSTAISAHGYWVHNHVQPPSWDM